MGRDRSPGGTGQAGVKSEQARRVHNKRDRDMQPRCQEPSDRLANIRRPLVSSRPTAFKWVGTWSIRDIQQCLQTFLVVTRQGVTQISSFSPDP